MKVRFREATTSSGRTFRWKDHFRRDPSSFRHRLLVGRSHLTVEEVLELLADGYSSEELVAECPVLTADDVQACILYTCAQRRLDRWFRWAVIIFIAVRGLWY